MATNKEILEALEKIEKSLPNGDLEICRNHLEDLQQGQEDLGSSLEKLKDLITYPEDGLVVRVNKNTYWWRQVDPLEVSDLKSFKANVTKALWIIFPTLITIILYSIFGIK